MATERTVGVEGEVEVKVKWGVGGWTKFEKGGIGNIGGSS